MARTEKGGGRQEQAAETRRKLLASARKLFAEQGYAATPVRSINRDIGMADGLLYHYFPGGKKEILKVMLEESFRKDSWQADSLTREMLETMPLREVMDRLLSINNGMLDANIDLVKIIIRDCNILEMANVEEMSAKLRRTTGWIAEMLQMRYERGEIRKMDFETAANQLMTMGIGNVIGKITGIGVVNLGDEEQRARMVDYLLDSWSAEQT